MVTYKITSLLGDTNNESSKSATRKWYVINEIRITQCYQNNTIYGEGNENGTTVKFKTQVIKSNLCHYSDAYILVTGDKKKQQVMMLIQKLHLKIVLHLQNA